MMTVEKAFDTVERVFSHKQNAWSLDEDQIRELIGEIGMALVRAFDEDARKEE